MGWGEAVWGIAAAESVIIGLSIISYINVTHLASNMQN